MLFGNGGTLDPPSSSADVPVRTGHSQQNLGVAGGRNAAARLASGDVLVFLDDDAVLRPGTLTAALSVLEGAPEVGAVAFSVVDPTTGQPAMWYQPYHSAWRGRRFEAVSVIGCGHAVRRECFEQLDGFWDGYFRELEEIDLSWRLLDAGWRILYEPTAQVEHPEKSARHTRHAVRSNLLSVWRLLPLGLALRQLSFKSALFLWRGVRHRELRACIVGFAEAVARAPRAGRSPVRRSTAAYLRRAYAPQGPGKRLQWSLRRLAPPPAIGGQPVASGAGSAPSDDTPTTPPHRATR